MEETQAGIRIFGRNINNLKIDDTTLMAESEEKLKSLLMKVKEESKKASLKLNISKTKIMASGPITSWQIDGETLETMTDFILEGSKIIADGDSSHLILCHPLLLLRSIPPSIRVFSNESTLRMRWPKYWSFSFNICPSNEHPGLVSFRMD